jgi:predicted PurR-regulated permease PerM
LLALRSGDVDPRAPAVAALLFVATELGYWSLQTSAARSERAAVARRILALAVAAFSTALVGSLVLGLTTGVGGGVALEAVGVAAAALTAAAIALLASRASV